MFFEKGQDIIKKHRIILLTLFKMPPFSKYSALLLFLFVAQILNATNLDSLENLLLKEQQQDNTKKEIELLIEIGKAQAQKKQL